MNVLYIIGNGLDISLGMKTSYQDFYDYYKNLATTDESIRQLKDSIESGRYQSWSDLEAGLGIYSKEITSDKVFLKCLADLKLALEDYLEEQYAQKRFQTESRFLEDFYSPQNYLDSQIRTRFDSFIGGFSAAYQTVQPRIVTLNYTSTLEYIFSSLRNTSPSLLHLHGSIESGMVMGVSEIEQIANIDFRKNGDVIEEFVKPVFNDACLNNNNAICERWIKESNIIVLYGTSVGITDKKWWTLIGERLSDEKSKILLVYFPYDENKDASLHPNYKRRWAEGYQKELVKKLFIPEEKWEQAYSRICVGINKSIFHLQQRPSVIRPPLSH